MVKNVILKVEDAKSGLSVVSTKNITSVNKPKKETHAVGTNNFKNNVILDESLSINIF